MSTSMVKRTVLISEEDEQEIIRRVHACQHNAPLFAAMADGERAEDYYIELELKLVVDWSGEKTMSTMIHLRKKGDEQ